MIHPMTLSADILIIGAGAAGLAAAIFAAEAGHVRGLRVVALEGARKPGAKILVSGGGRCNVTNDRVTPDDYWGGPRPLIRSVLKAFDERRTVEWMRGMGVELKREPTGKLFPVTDSARMVLDALLRRAEESGARLIAGARVEELARENGGGFRIGLQNGEVWHARRVIMAAGGLSLPKSGSDGWGLGAAREFGHSIIPTEPALVPLLLRGGAEPGGQFADLSGVTVEARLGLFDEKGKRLIERRDSLLFTHFGLSGPAAMDLSRHIFVARRGGPAHVCLAHPDFPNIEAADKWLLEEARRHPRRSPAAAMSSLWPERLAHVLTSALPDSLAGLTREQRRALAVRLARLPLDVTGPRGWAFAETTAGGVDLREVDVRSMESRRVPGLHFCGEMLDVDGRIGGFNFQWAWASGWQAGRAAAAML